MLENSLTGPIFQFNLRPKNRKIKQYLYCSRYCNRRIVRFTKDGEYVNEIVDEQLWVPHGLALADDLDLLCVADRENLR